MQTVYLAPPASDVATALAALADAPDCLLVALMHLLDNGLLCAAVDSEIEHRAGRS